MTVAVASLGCDRKAAEGFPSWPTLFELDGDYSLYLNYEGTCGFRYFRDVCGDRSGSSLMWSFDEWYWGTGSGRQWRSVPKFDQDQARLASIVAARSMCRQYALETGASHLLFVDADIIPPKDIIPKLLEVNKRTVGGLVYGRGVHSSCPYIFQERRRWTENGIPLVECEHGNIGFCLIRRDVLEQITFRTGVGDYPDGRKHLVSDDPAYHLDTFRRFGEWHYIRTDVVGQHIGDLKAGDVAQF